MDPPLSADRLRSLNDLLATALGLAPAERAPWLARLPAEHGALAPLLGSLLERAGVESDSFMRRPAGAVLAAMTDEGNDSFETREQPGDLIGPFRLLHELGRGGMSVVWLAERADGAWQRQVALKLPHELGGHGLAARMARERDILAWLEHPRIARLYDAGVSADGRPWLAMERIEGVPIDTHCREHALDLRQRLRLFLQVAGAVAHAHSRLVVHRDLKPSNILVTPEGEVRLLDFGVAQLLDDEAGADHQLTRRLGRPVTPDYAAPEQVGAQPVGTAADVYSLGIVLYELLTGERPYRVGQHSATTLEQAILQAVVPPPSTRMPDRAGARALRGDLDTIVGKALRKRAQDRYSSVEAFAADVQRQLDGEPVLAQAPSRRYRLRKFVRRHRLVLAASSAVALSLIVGMGVALWQAGTARAEAARAQRSQQFIASVLKQAQPRQGSGGAALAADLLAAAADRIETELAGDPRAAAELGVTIGEGFSSLGDPQRGEAALRAAVARAETAWGPRHPLTVRGRALLAESLAVQKPQEALGLIEQVVPEAMAGVPATLDIAMFALRMQSFQIAKLNRAEASYVPLKQALALAGEHLGTHHNETIHTLGLLSNTYGRFGERALQLDTAAEAVRRAEEAFGPQRPHLTLTAVERWYAEALRANDLPGDAIPILRRVLQDQRQLDAADTLRVRNAMLQLGLAQAEAGELAQALQWLRQAMALEAQHNPIDSEDRVIFAESLAAALAMARRPNEALALLEKVDPVAQRLPPSSPARQLAIRLRHARLLALAGHPRSARHAAEEVAREVGEVPSALRAEAWHLAGLNARLQGQPREAHGFAQRAWDDPGRALARPATRAAIAAELATVWLDRGEPARAEPLVREALASYAKAQVTKSARSATAWIAQARLHLNAGRLDEAQAALLPLRTAWAEVAPGSEWEGETLYWLARVQAQRGEQAAAEKLRRSALPLLRASTLPALRTLAAH